MELGSRILCTQCVKRTLFILILKVDFATLRELPERFDALRDRLARRHQRTHHIDERARATVGAPHVAKVEVPAQFATKRCARLAQLLLHEYVTHAPFNRHAARRTHTLFNGARATQVVHNRGTRLRLQPALRQPRGQQVAANRFALLINHHATVRITVKAHTKVRLQGANTFARRRQIRFHQRIRFMHKFAGGVIEIDRGDLQTLHRAEHLRHHGSRHTV